MKKIKGIILIVISLIFLSAFRLQKEELVADEDLTLNEMIALLVTEIPEESQLHYQALSDDGKAYYDYFLDFIVENPIGEPIIFEYRNITEEQGNLIQNEIFDALGAFLKEHKEFFWYGGYSVSMNVSGTVNSPIFEFLSEIYIIESYLTVDNQIKMALIAEDLANMLVVLNQITNDVNALNTEYEKFKYIHDWLVLNNSYEKTSDLSHTPIAALLEGRAGPVCEAYAEAFLILAYRANLNAVYITGEASDGNGVFENHAWNNVKLGNMWYLIDVTWDDPVGAPIDYISYDYFLIPNLDSEERKIDPDNVNPTPFATAKFDNIPAYKIDIYIDEVKKETVYITSGGDLVIPRNLEKTGYDLIFTTETTEITSEQSFYGTYVIKKFRVNFYADDILISSQTVEYNNYPVEPDVPGKEGFVFEGWDYNLEKITTDTTYNARYRPEIRVFEFTDNFKIAILIGGFVLGTGLVVVLFRILLRKNR